MKYFDDFFRLPIPPDGRVLTLCPCSGEFGGGGENYDVGGSSET